MRGFNLISLPADQDLSRGPAYVAANVGALLTFQSHKCNLIGGTFNNRKNASELALHTLRQLNTSDLEHLQITRKFSGEGQLEQKYNRNRRRTNANTDVVHMISAVALPIS